MTPDGDHGFAHHTGHAGAPDQAGHQAHPGGHDVDDELEPELMPDKPRTVTEEDRLRYEGYLAEILTALGLDLDTPGTSATPRRLLRALFDTTSGYEGDPKLLTAFPTECRGGANCEIAQVVEGPIPFFALCEHHALPFFGNVYVGYVAHEGIIGISKLTRLVRVVTRRFGVQERMTFQIADELDRMMAPHGVAVYVEAHHLCTQMRGVRELHPKTRTTSYRGAYVESPQLRGEFFDVSGLRRAEF
jgi:GTP cyclohydrolase I